LAAEERGTTAAVEGTNVAMESGSFSTILLAHVAVLVAIQLVVLQQDRLDDFAGEASPGGGRWRRTRCLGLRFLGAALLEACERSCC